MPNLTFEQIERIINKNKGAILNNYIGSICNWCFNFRKIEGYLNENTDFLWVRCSSCVTAHMQQKYLKIKLSEKDLFTIKCLI